MLPEQRLDAVVVTLHRNRLPQAVGKGHHIATDLEGVAHLCKSVRYKWFYVLKLSNVGLVRSARFIFDKRKKEIILIILISFSKNPFSKKIYAICEKKIPEFPEFPERKKLPRHHGTGGGDI